MTLKQNQQYYTVFILTTGLSSVGAECKEKSLQRRVAQVRCYRIISTGRNEFVCTYNVPDTVIEPRIYTTPKTIERLDNLQYVRQVQEMKQPLAKSDGQVALGFLVFTAFVIALACY
jgi:hypothetical protein